MHEKTILKESNQHCMCAVCLCVCVYACVASMTLLTEMCVLSLRRPSTANPSEPSNQYRHTHTHNSTHAECRFLSFISLCHKYQSCQSQPVMQQHHIQVLAL